MFSVQQNEISNALNDEISAKVSDETITIIQLSEFFRQQEKVKNIKYTDL